MIPPTLLATYFDNNVKIVKMQVEGLSHADSLKQLPFRANCLNWVVGHLVSNRLTVLQLLEVETPFDPGRVARYERDSEPITADGAGVLPLDELIRLLESLQTLVTEQLAAVSNEMLDKEIIFCGTKARSISEWLFFSYFHDTYHLGQTEILRQAAGKNDKII